MSDDPDKTRTTTPAGAGGSGEPADADDLAPGTVIGSYVVQGTVASGGGGTVYAAQHSLLGRQAAIKVLRAEMANSPQGLARFLREARVVNMIRHPNIVDIYEFGKLPDGRPYFIMELLEGSDLRTLVGRRGRFRPEEVQQVLEPICSALEASHALGVVHRDLKAGNINVAVKEGRFVVKLLDFGIAKLIYPDADGAGLTAVGTRLGTSYSMAPEQIRGGAIDRRTDVYALGVLIYYLLTGRHPFRAGTRQEIERMNLEAPPPKPSQVVPVPAAVDAVVLRCMEKTSELRYESAAAVAQAFREALTVPEKREDSAADAVAVLIELRTEGVETTDDEALLEDSAEILDMAEQALRDAGFAMPLQTSTAVLGARILPTESGEQLAERQRAFDLARSLMQQIKNRANAHSQLQVTVSFHVDTAVVRDSPDGPAIAGGGIVEVGGWDAKSSVDGVLATPASLASLAVR